jgi:predicted phosphodiesterase
VVYGNHDIVKRSAEFAKRNLYHFYDGHTDSVRPLFEGIKAHEGIILRHTPTGRKLLLVHGHQGDLIDDGLWRLGCFLVRYLWRNLELFGFKDPTSAAKNNLKQKRVERRIIQWAKARGQIVIAGHTHRPMCSPDEDMPYFNDGSCVHPSCITCIEIVRSQIILVRWDIRTREDRSMYVNRQEIALPRPIVPPAGRDPD